jgi:RNA recognition motif-containing protein
MRIIIRNLESNTTEADVQAMLADCGDVTVNQVKAVVQQGTGRITTCAYLIADDRIVGEAVITKLHDTELGGARISVKEQR